MREKCVLLSAEYLCGLLQKRNDLNLKKHAPLKCLRLLVLNRRVRKAAKLLFAVAEASSLQVLK